MTQVNMDRYEKLGCLHEMFVKQALLTPDKVAVVHSGGNQITFGELNNITDVLALKLRRIGVGRNKIVGILMERCLEYVISYIAILKAGGAYFPIEVSYPAEFLKSVIEDAQPMTVCTKISFLDRLPNDVPVILLEGDWMDKFENGNDYCHDEISKSVSVSLDDMAYTVYSSGTTGKPKGIQCPHRGAVFSYTWRHLAYPYEEDDREACNIFFVWEMLRPLLKGIPMYIIPDDVIYDPPKLLAFLEANSITRMLFTPSLLQAVFESPAVNVQKSFKTIKELFLCGEVVTMALRNQVVNSVPHVKLINLYSISECHDVAACDLSADVKFEDRTYCPCGKVFPGVKVLILDGNKNVVPVGCHGEVYVAGPTLAIGYLNRPDLNAERFIDTPKTLNKIGPRLYKTGDWGYLLSDNSLEIIGRCDTMVKIRGYTIELKAVEAALLSIEAVQMACVLVIGDEGMDKVLTAYVVLQYDMQLSIAALKKKLKEKLPFYMIPSQIIYLDKIPIQNTTGKIDKNALPAAETFDQKNIIIDDSWSELEKLVTRVLCETLRISSIEKDENFFNLGGHSLLAAAAISNINEICRSNLSTVDMYMNPTVEMLHMKLQGKEVSQQFDLNAELKNNLTDFNISKIRLITFWKSIALSKQICAKGNVLLTGASGFLGSFILRELLLSTEMTVYCLVRRTNEESAEKRLLNLLNSFHVPPQTISERVVLIEGDVSLKKFGLIEAEYTTLCSDIHFVIHAASYVNLVLPYNAVYRSNVLGTKNVLSFCLQDRLKLLHYISTSEVFPMNAGVCPEEYTELDNGEKLKNGYGQSKWISEQLIRRAQIAGCPTIITRCGNLGGPLNFEGWKWNENDLIFYIIKSVINTRVAPNITALIELTPVDYASKLIVKLTQNISSSCGGIFHIINNGKLMNYNELWCTLNEMGVPIRTVSYSEWKETIKSIAIQHASLRKMLPLFNFLLKDENYLLCNNYYDQNRLKQFLDDFEISPYPVINKCLLKRYLIQLRKHGYLDNVNIFEKKNESIISRNHLHGKVILVIGASSGIGYSIATELAADGAALVIAAARSIDKLNALKEKLIRCHNKTNLVPLKLDITDAYQVQYAVGYIEHIYGPINVFVNSAGVMSYCKMENAELDDWQNMLDVNCKGILNCLSVVLPVMVNRSAGHIVNITSDAGRRPFSGLAVYSGTKFFLEAISGSIRQEVAKHGIKVTCIQPGDVQTGLHDKSKDKTTLDECAYKIPFLEPADVANAVLFAIKQSPNCAVNEILVEPILGPI